jgi:3-dehydroquinate synthase
MLSAVEFLKAHFPQVNMDAAFDDELLHLMRQDKKNHKGQIQFALLRRIGEPVINVETNEDTVRSAFDFIRTSYDL